MEGNKQKANRILFLVSDTGGAHRNCANAIISSLNEISDRDITPIIMDFFRETNKRLDKKIKDFYSKSIRKSSIAHGILFHMTNNKYVWSSIQPIYNLIYKSLKEKIMMLMPDIIISTHPLVNHITCKILRDLNLKIPFMIVIVDHVTLHQSWIEPYADYFIVASEEARRRLLRENIEDSKIKNLGYMINPVFYEHISDIITIKKELGIRENSFTVLFTGGGDGGGRIYPIVKQILKENLDCEIIVICGRNNALNKRLSGFPIKLMGYTDRMHDFVSIADLIVGKAGSATIEEAISNGKPLILTSYVYGQEEGNIEYAKKRTIAYYETNPKKVVMLVKKHFLSRKRDFKKVPKEDAPVYKIASFINGVLESHNTKF